MINIKTNIILFFFAFITTINAQTNELELKIIKANNLYSELKEKEHNPIYVINGVILEDYSVIYNIINPENIKSLDILEDQIALEKYGQKGKNGVIIVTLKNSDARELEKLEKQSKPTKFEKRNYKITVLGVVTNSDKQPISGVIISNLTKKEAYYTDLEGKYKINVSKKDILNFSCLGFESKSIEISNNSNQNMVLKEIDANKLGGILIKKPVIYLYPTSKTDVTFSLNFKGTLLTTFPKYQTNWQITAYPDGKLLDKKTNRFYSSLFWDGSQTFLKEHYQYTTGFVVSKINLANFLIEKLETIGLNNSETNDFIQFWLPILEKNETNFIHFYTNSEYDVFSTNNVSPKPDTSIRIFMEFYALKHQIEIPEQKFSKTERKGFTLVEWGGADVTEQVATFKQSNL